MADFYPSEKGVIRRDSPKEAYLDKVSREVLAKGFGESLNLLPIPIAGMAAKLSLPATDVLARWIRRFRKDKPPTVPFKHLEKAARNEQLRRGEPNYDPQTGKVIRDKLFENPTILEKSSPIDTLTHRGGHNIGFSEVGDLDVLEAFIDEQIQHSRTNKF